jgi:hypothetical protein
MTASAATGFVAKPHEHFGLTGARRKGLVRILSNLSFFYLQQRRYRDVSRHPIKLNDKVRKEIQHEHQTFA